MSIGIDSKAHLELVRHYRTASTTLRHATRDLGPLLHRASDLLNNPRATQINNELSIVRDELRLDALDLEQRGQFLIEADARLAAQLSAQAGDIVNRHLAQQAIDNGWTYNEAELRLELAALRRLSPEQQIRRASDIRRLEETLRILDSPHTANGIYGDLDANLTDHRVGPPLRITSTTPKARGRDLLIRALDDTANQDRILRDEFQAILHDNGNLTLVLPGVIDLSSPGIGLDTETNSTRDLDQNAFPSSHSTELNDNNYGLRVRDWVDEQIDSGAIAQGARTTIIGHSYGGDTAVDLAADPHINGQLLNITHVYSAAYHNEPQFGAVPPHTNVVAAQNIYDLPVLGEEIVANADAVLSGEWEGMSHGLPTPTRWVVEGAETLANGANWLVNETLNEIEDVVAAEHDIHFDVPDIPHIEILDDQHYEVTNKILLVQFEGGAEGYGHHQNNYTTALQGTENLRLLAFMAELDDAGFTADGTTLSVDVTDPNA